MLVPVPLPEGLTAWLVPEGPEMWHEFALGLDFADPRATIDLLIAADAVTRHPDCDRATAALILAKAAGAGFHLGHCPAALDGGAARALVVRLSDALVTGSFPTARRGLPPAALRLVRQMLGPRGPLEMPPLSFGSGPHAPRHVFAGWRPMRPGRAVRVAA
jgi:hypothetical protein